MAWERLRFYTKPAGVRCHRTLAAYQALTCYIPKTTQLGMKSMETWRSLSRGFEPPSGDGTGRSGRPSRGYSDCQGESCGPRCYEDSEVMIPPRGTFPFCLSGVSTSFWTLDVSWNKKQQLTNTSRRFMTLHVLCTCVRPCCFTVPTRYMESLVFMFLTLRIFDG